MMASSVLVCFLHFLLLAVAKQASSSSKLVLEDGYTVSTLLDANKLKYPIHPFSLLPRPGQEDDLFLLDSASSSFYTLSFPISKDSAVDRYAGNGVDGFADGEANAAMFHRPRSFAVDSIGNVYVADRNNHAIRKIMQSGVTTIAGGYSNTTGHTDGPAQNASFSNDFDLTFLPRRCILLISDRGNRLIRQMNLKPGDCAHHAPPAGAGLGVPMVSSIGVLCSLIGLIVGLQISGDHRLSKMWKHCQTKVGRRVLITFYGIISVVASSRPYQLLCEFVRMNLTVLSLMVGICRVRRHSLICKHVGTKPQSSRGQTKDLVNSEGRKSVKQGDDESTGKTE
eukprot:TRINITY_DN1659_c0_g1_i2.p1 TRINITY_DN1659_c0_g1~~TRINITY_DN1659_c0_g1_i2.p1  ORF type:complete len:373 (+),score=37.04 TRINITY_DN1659_c0_g1_i2:104-1120(+)